jgi:hypothetical protein
LLVDIPSMNLANVGWFTLTLIGVVFLIYGVIVAAAALSSCGVGPGCTWYPIPGVDSWALALGFTDFGLALVWIGANRLAKLVTKPIEVSLA